MLKQWLQLWQKVVVCMDDNDLFCCFSCCVRACIHGSRLPLFNYCFVHYIFVKFIGNVLHNTQKNEKRKKGNYVDLLHQWWEIYLGRFLEKWHRLTWTNVHPQMIKICWIKKASDCCQYCVLKNSYKKDVFKFKIWQCYFCCASDDIFLKFLWS